MRSLFSAFILLTAVSLCKGETTPVSLAEISAILQYRDVLFKSNMEIEDLFSREAGKFYSGIRKGFFELGSGNISNPNAIELVQDFQLTFHQDHFCKFKNGMIGIFNRIAVDHFLLPQTAAQDKILQLFRERAEKKAWPEGCQVAGFEDPDSSNLLFFALPAAVYRKLVSLCRLQTALVFNFNLSHGKIVKRYWRCKMASFYFVRNKKSHFEAVIFRNRMKIDSPEINTGWIEKTDLKMKWCFREKEIRKMGTCMIDFYQGADADHVWNCFVLKNYHRVQQDAVDGNPIAMFDFAEHFKAPEYWYHAAALMGEKKAQQKLKWKNGGFAFGIREIYEQLVIWKPHPDYPLREGKILLSVDGTQVKSLIDISRLICQIPPGENVCLEFADGEKVSCRLLPKP